MRPFDISYTQSSAVCIFSFYVVLRRKISSKRGNLGAVQWKQLESEQALGSRHVKADKLSRDRESQLPLTKETI